MQKSVKNEFLSPFSLILKPKTHLPYLSYQNQQNFSINNGICQVFFAVYSILTTKLIRLNQRNQ
jgi:hypothetical protein